jgi:hypothetical protein
MSIVQELNEDIEQVELIMIRKRLIMEIFDTALSQVEIKDNMYDFEIMGRIQSLSRSLYVYQDNELKIKDLNYIKIKNDNINSLKEQIERLKVWLKDLNKEGGKNEI